MYELLVRPKASVLAFPEIYGSLGLRFFALLILLVTAVNVVLDTLLLKRVVGREGWKRANIAVWALSEPYACGIGLALLSLLIARFTGWSLIQRLGYSFVMFLSVEIVLLLTMTLPLVFSRFVRVALLIFGGALYWAGTVILL